MRKSISLFFVICIFFVVGFVSGYFCGDGKRIEPIEEMDSGYEDKTLPKTLPDQTAMGNGVLPYYEEKQFFYLGVRGNEVIVYYPDKKTEYFNTGILLKQFPWELQEQIKNFYYIENDTKLFGFLESYSS